MESFIFQAVLMKEAKGYSALCLDVDVASQGRTRAARRNLEEAVAGYVETAMAGNLPVLRPVPPDENPLNRQDGNVVERFRLRVALSVSVHA